ncbi:MAG: putative CRISPR-associated protein [Thiomonas sp. 13-66-29]|jgi:CRISPR-associated protein Csx16|nr:MAG: putative CRISPR-associated protein [Thiomonas sp. 13-66-29]
MTVYFVSRHEGAMRWVRYQQKLGKLPYDIDASVQHLDLDQIGKGDVVIGTLPLRDVAELGRKGAAYLSLDLRVPEGMRGKDLTATEMAAFGATLTAYRVKVKEVYDIDAAPKPRKPVPQADALTIMLVSQELAPQYLGYIHQPTPRVLMVVTPAMRERAKALQTLLETATTPPQDIRRLHLSDDQGYQHVVAQADEALDKFLGDGAQSITINLTGGTKLMSLAFTQAGQDALRAGDNIRLQYVDTLHGQIEWLGTGMAQPMYAVLDVGTAVRASGKPVHGCASASAVFRQQMQRSALHTFLLAAEPSLIGSLNALGVDMENAYRGKSAGPMPVLEPGKEGGAKAGRFVLTSRDNYRVNSLRRLLKGKLGKLLHAEGVLRCVPTQESDALVLELARPSEIDYIKGGWLEAHVAARIEACKPDDWACGVEIGAGRGRNNEIDAIVVSGNRTLLIEVKTANLNREQAQDNGETSTKGQDTIYKLDSIGHDLARHFNTNWLVSARSLSDADLERAKDKRISVFAPDVGSKNAPHHAKQAMVDFETQLRAWIAAGRELTPAGRRDIHAALPVSATWSKREDNDAFVAKATTDTKAKKADQRGAGLKEADLAKLAALKSGLSKTKPA